MTDVASLPRRPLGRSGIEVSAIGLGCGNFGSRVGAEGTRAVVDAALAAGIDYFDTADVYGGGDSERFLGAALGDRRESVVVATKFGSKWQVVDERAAGSRAYMRDRVEGSLGRLGTDYVDLLYYHWPDGVTPIGETLHAMWELVDEGSVRAIGCSNFNAEQLREAEREAMRAGRPSLAAVQNEYSLANREAESAVLPLCRELSIGFVPYFPLANGLLTGKYRRGEPAPPGTRLAGAHRPIPDAYWDAVWKAEAFARARGRSVLELAIAALVAQPGVTSVIVGATRPEQLRENIAASAWALAPADLRALAAALE